MTDIIVKYCQTLLKSIPATITNAEEMYLKKTKLISALPNTAAELKALIDSEQKPFAIKVQRHLLFFSDLKFKYGLPLPVQAIEGLKNCLQPMIKYIELLEQESLTLARSDIQAFLILWKQEQNIQYDIATIFKKRPNLKETGMFNFLYDIGKSLVSPIGQSLILLLLLAAMSFPCFAFRQDPIILPVQQAMTWRDDIIINDLDIFVNELTAAGWLTKKITPDIPGAPTIIIKEDVHGTPRYERDFVKHVLRKYGINVVAMEGWAGFEQDTARGFTLLNGEEEFIKEMLRDESFLKIGLEDAKLQEKVLQHILVRDLIDYKADKAMKINRIKEIEKDIENQKKDYAVRPDPHVERRIRNYVEWIEGINCDIARIDRSIEEMPSQEAELAALHINPTELKQIHAALLDKTPEEIRTIWKEVGIKGRSESWVEKITGEIKAKNLKAVVVVIGRGHTSSFVEALKQLGAFNVLIVSSEK